MIPKSLFLILSSSTIASAAIYVSPSGNDTADGSKQRPVASPQRALDLSVSKNDPTIYFNNGTYLQQHALLVEPQHSGSKDAPRVFKAQSEGKVIFSAGIKVELEWKRTDAGIYEASVPAEIDLQQGFDGLFIEGEAPRMARFPNYDRSARWLKGSSAEAFSAKRIATWKTPKGGILHAMHPSHWGGNHWTITGKKSATECTLEGGWMNNRGGGIHPKDRFVENIFEELDTASEWFLDKQSRKLSFKPAGDFSEGKGSAIFARHESCVRIIGSEDKPVKHIEFDGISFRHTTRSFMKTKEPLLRSDWKIYRGGAFFVEGAENIKLTNAEFTQLGGNAYFASGYNRKLEVSRSHFHQIGAGAINFVGLSSAVYNGQFDPYGPPVNWSKLNKSDKGPKTNDYPAECVASDCLIHDIGLVEKQVAGLQISVAHKVTGSHLSIYDVPRAGINIGENAFGGHLIEHCDVFDTVQESSDHGSFNSWGRDRFWHTNYGQVNKQVAEHPELPLIDMLDGNVIRNSRWRCDHGWDIDLDDGSSNYIVESNLCLGGGIKLREGYHRTVRNNLVVANTFHPHVWFTKSEDKIYSNIWATPYQPIRLGGKGSKWDNNIHLTSEGLSAAEKYGVDSHGVVVELKFSSPEKLDFTFPVNKTVTKSGFKPFELSQFGVQKASLKQIARTPSPPTLAAKETTENTQWELMGATIKNVTTLGEVSATGLPDSDRHGAYFLTVAKGSAADRAGIRSNDVIRSLNGKDVANVQEFLFAWAGSANEKVPAVIWRNQKAIKGKLPSFPGAALTASTAVIDGSAAYDKGKDYIGRWTTANTKLKWSIKLKPNTNYKVLLESAYTGEKVQRFTLSGLSQNVSTTVAKTDAWEDFKVMSLPSSVRSKSSSSHKIELAPSSSQKLQPALMNFRKIILIEE